ncbi:MAG TPA: peptidylprolyl isomerase [Steroidobacteraceae bacterium]|jgi:cyclophilin family peptidyl-prolyl cis-trans isomerase|nr:peptidylprolyl isomerase [Steroidobacteraceae bacterium]
MKQILLILGLIAACPTPGLGADTPPAPAAKPAVTSLSPQLQVVTSMGNFTIELNPERAPLTVAHFLSYVDQGYYSNTIFHRVVQSFVIQAGGFDADYNPKHATARVVNESGNGLSNVRSSVGMARTQAPHAADAQFYVNLNDNQALDPQQTRWGYAVFGRVIQGMDVVDKIGNVATGSHGILKEETPLKPVVILRIERVPSP